MDRIVLPEANGYLVSYSGGKDSLAVLDICCRSGKFVEAFFMYFIPGLDYTEHVCQYAEERYRVKVHRVQHWVTSGLIRDGVWRSMPSPQTPRIKLVDVEGYVRQQSGLEWTGYGYRSNDSLERRAMMNKWVDGICPAWKRFSPIKTWNEKDVLSYLSRNRIDIVGGPMLRRCNGIDLTPTAMEWLREDWPEDYRRILKVFPHAMAQADRAPLIREQKRMEQAAKRMSRSHKEQSQ